MNTNHDEQLLEEFYKNSRMGCETIDHLLPKVDSVRLKRELTNQRASYECYAKSAASMLRASYHKKPQEISPLKTASVRAGVFMNTAMDSTPSHIAEMMIQGGTMGVVDLTKQIKEHQPCGREVQQLGQDLLAFEQKTIENMKSFL